MRKTLLLLSLFMFLYGHSQISKNISVTFLQIKTNLQTVNYVMQHIQTTNILNTFIRKIWVIHHSIMLIL